MKITKKILSMILAVVMVLGLLPATAFAIGAEDVVCLSISFDSGYIDDKNGNPIAYVPIPVSKIEAIDLSEYGLDNMLFDADGDGEYETTALQLLIYAHEELYGGDWGEVNFDALPGSSYFKGGIFGFTENLVYFHNGDFPVDESQQSDYMTVGATSDRIVLEAGDFLDVASFSCYSFLWDQLGGFHLFADENDNYTHDYTANTGTALNIKLKHSFCDLMYGIAWVKDAEYYEVYYGTTFGQAEGSVTTDESGNATVTFPQTGTYYIWCEGGIGIDDGFTHTTCDHYMETGEPCIVSSPAFAKVTVTGAAAPEAHTVTFVDGNGNVLQTQTVLNCENAAYSGETPTKDFDDDWHYIFKGWDKALTNITEDTTISAIFDAIKHNYTYINNGESHTFGCENCDYTATSSHTYIDGTCICGAEVIKEPVLNTKLNFNIAISVGAEMQVVYTIPTKIVSSYESFCLEISKAVCGAEPVVTTYGFAEGMTELETVTNASGATVAYRVTYTGIFAKEMGDVFTATLYATDANGAVHYSDTKKSSIKTYLTEKLNDENSTAELKTLAVDMLNYGAAAQINFGYDVENLVNADLTKEQKSLGTQTIPGAVDTSSITGDGCNVRTSVSLQSKVLLYVNCMYTCNENSNLIFVIKDKYGKILDELAPSMQTAKFCQGVYGNVGARQMRDLITIELYDNGVLVSKTVSWNIESYVAQTRANTKETEAKISAVNALLTYGDSAAIYLESTGQ